MLYLIPWADVLGYAATLMFFLQYIPQMTLNYTRKSVRGFSTLGVVIKMVGASFFMTNFLILGERWPTTLYSIICTMQYAILISQAAIYERKYFVVAVLFVPVPCALLSHSFPATMQFTTVVKPATQVLSHIPVMYACYREKSVKGISLLSMHMNAIGGVLGIWMCLLESMKSPWTIAIYVNSFMQAVTVYVLVWMYGENEVSSSLHAKV